MNCPGNVGTPKIDMLSLVPWLATTVTSTSRYLPCVRALGSTPCRGERHRVGKWGEQGREQRWERQWKAGEGMNGTGNGERGGRRKRGGQQELDSKRHPLVKDVSGYSESYEKEGAN